MATWMEFQVPAGNISHFVAEQNDGSFDSRAEFTFSFEEDGIEFWAAKTFRPVDSFVAYNRHGEKIAEAVYHEMALGCCLYY